MTAGISSMNNLHSFLEEILNDQAIEASELVKVCDYIVADEVLDMRDVELLIKLYTEAKVYPPEFEELFFGVLKSVMLDNGKIVDYERLQLMRMLYSNRVVRRVEIDFLENLQSEADEVSPEFVQMLSDAKQAYDKGHDVGGRQS